MMQKLFILLIFTQLFVFTHTTRAQQRPKIGLVLSGGGAKGLAHVGVLKVLEEAGIVPDYITGTSMGAIVGGLYSVGYSADELEQIVLDVNWDEVLSNKLPLYDVAIEEKDAYNRHIFELPMKGIVPGLPKGLIQGYKLSELLNGLTRSAHDIHDFNEFPIPFACMGTDIVTGEAVVLNKGSLPQALRASMALPSIFTPVEMDDRMLIDGGVVHNFPVQEAIDMGADILIGVSVSVASESKESLDNMVSLLIQSAFVTNSRVMPMQMEKLDVFIEPDMGIYTTGSFNSGREIMDIGEQAARPFLDDLKLMADTVYAREPPRKVSKLVGRNLYTINEIRVKGNHKIKSKFIVGKLDIEQGETVTIHKLIRRLSLLYGTGYFEQLEYQLVRGEEVNGHILEILVTESAEGLLKLAAHYDSENRVGLNANLTYRNVFISNSRLIGEVDFAEFPRFDGDYQVYLGDKQEYAFSVGLNYLKSNYPNYEEGKKTSEFSSSHYNVFAKIFSTVSQYHSFGFKANQEWSTFKPIVGDSAVWNIDRLTNQGLNLSLYYEYNSIDKLYYTRRGALAYLAINQRLSSGGKLRLHQPEQGAATNTSNFDFENYTSFNARYKQYIGLGSKTTAWLDYKLALSTLQNIEYNYFDYYFLGGFRPQLFRGERFLGANQKEYRLSSFFVSEVGVQYEFMPNWYLSGTVNYLDVEYPMKWIVESAYDNAIHDSHQRRLGFAVELGTMTLFGPVGISLAMDQYTQKLLANVNIGFYY